MIWNLAIIGIIFLVGFLVNHLIKFKKLKLDNKVAQLTIRELRNKFETYRRLSEYGSSQVEDLEKKNRALLMENMQLKSAISAYRNAYGDGYWNHNSAAEISKDTVDAVRYAMKKSHPDNGGNAEDFVRFKKCYEELTRR